METNDTRQISFPNIPGLFTIVNTWFLTGGHIKGRLKSITTRFCSLILDHLLSPWYRGAIPSFNDFPEGTSKGRRRWKGKCPNVLEKQRLKIKLAGRETGRAKRGTERGKRWAQKGWAVEWIKGNLDHSTDTRLIPLLPNRNTSEHSYVNHDFS